MCVPGFRCQGAVDRVEAEHQGRVEQSPCRIPLLERSAGPGGKVAIARAIDEGLRAHRVAPRFGFDQQRVDPIVGVHHHAGAERVKQNRGAACKQQVVGGAFVGGGIVGLRLRLAEDEMWRIQSTEPVDAGEDFVGDAVHHLADVAMHVGVEPAEIGHPGGGAHPAEKPVTLNQQNLAPEPRGRGRCRDPGGPAAEHHHVEFAAHRHLPFGLTQGLRVGHGRRGVLTCLTISQLSAWSGPPNTRDRGRGAPRSPAPQTG